MSGQVDKVDTVLLAIFLRTNPWNFFHFFFQRKERKRRRKAQTHRRSHKKLFKLTLRIVEKSDFFAGFDGWRRPSDALKSVVPLNMSDRWHQRQKEVAAVIYSAQGTV